MARRTDNSREPPRRRGRPAETLEDRENQLIALAFDFAEERLRDGTATSQLATEFLRRGSTRARLEQEMLAERTKLARAKTEALESAARVEELYQNALDAMKAYSGQRDSYEDL